VNTLSRILRGRNNNTKGDTLMIRSIRERVQLAAGLCTTLLAIPAAYADDAPPPVGWTGQGQAGAVLARGNADTTTADVKLDASDTIAQWKHIAHFAFLYGNSAGLTTAQRLEAAWQTNYQFGKKAFVFGSVNGEDDRFDGFVYQATLSTGLGYKLIDSNTTKLTGTLGFGYRRLQPEQLVKDVDGRVIDRIKGDSTSDGVGTAGLDYMQQLTGTTRLTDKLLVQSGGQNTSVANDFAVAVNMTNTLALSVGYGLRYNSAPPAGSKTTDQLTTVNLVYSFNSPTRK
jgi:putative salt-induced outer membrane protein